MAGDRVVIRQIAPPDTLGGGRCWTPHPRKHGPSRDLLVTAGADEPRGDEPGDGRTREARARRPPRAARRAEPGRPVCPRAP